MILCRGAEKVSAAQECEGTMAGAKYKDNKPEMEKKRRSRINESLSCLKLLVLGEVRRKNTRISKLDKADILEMAVEYVQRMNIQSRGMVARVDKYRAGFNACAEEVRKHLAQTPDVDIDVRTRIVDHLANFVQNLQWLRRHDILPHDVVLRHNIAQPNDVKSQNDFMSHSATSRHDGLASDAMYSKFTYGVMLNSKVGGGSTSDFTSQDEPAPHTRHRERHYPICEKDFLCQGETGIRVRSVDSSSFDRDPHKGTSYVDNCSSFHKTHVSRSFDHSEREKDSCSGKSPVDSRQLTSHSLLHGVVHVSKEGNASDLSDQDKFENTKHHRVTEQPWELDANGNQSWPRVWNNKSGQCPVRETDGGGKLMGHGLRDDGQQVRGNRGHAGESNMMDNHLVWRPW